MVVFVALACSVLLLLLLLFSSWYNYVALRSSRRFSNIRNERRVEAEAEEEEEEEEEEEIKKLK